MRDEPMKITVVIPAYNAEQTIGRAIDSVLAQTRPADEVIVIDDGSVDGTAEVVRAYGDKVIFIQQENAGVSVARNAGIEAATSDWIAFLDADDEWLPEKLKCQTEHLSRNPELTWTYSNFYKKHPGHKSLRPAHMSGKTDVLLQGREYFEDYLQSYVNHAFAWTCAILIRRDVFETVGMFEPGMKRAQDNDLWYRIAYQYPKVGYLAEPLAVYHLDTPGSSTKINDQVDFMTGLIERHMQLSEKAGRGKDFRPCITHMIQIWIRRCVCSRRYADVRILLGRFADYLPARFRREMRFRLTCPPLTMWVADGVMKFKKISREN